MAHAASIDRLLQVLREKASDEVDALADEKRRVRGGLLSVGIKLHCLAGENQFQPLISALGGEHCLERNLFKSARARFCLVLPPVGSAEAAILLLEAIEHYTGSRIFENADIQLQVCSPGRLTARNAALHAIAFYLGSDTIRQYDLDEFETTVSDKAYYRGRRLVIYDAGQFGDFDGAFVWWAHGPHGLNIRPALPFLNSRTDLLVGPGSRTDIRNINFVATLLVHSQSASADGYWSALGSSFADDMSSLLNSHLLSGLLEAPWVRADERTWIDPQEDQSFFAALQELTAYAVDEAHRIDGMHAKPDTSGGILADMQELLERYRSTLSAAVEKEHGEQQWRSPINPAQSRS